MGKVQIFPSFGRIRRDACRVAVEGRHMKHLGLCLLQGSTFNAVLSHGEVLQLNAMAFINPLHLIIGRRFHGKALFFSQDLRQKGIEILCSGPQNHLLFLHKDSPSSSQIFLQRSS